MLGWRPKAWWKIVCPHCNLDSNTKGEQSFSTYWAIILTLIWRSRSLSCTSHLLDLPGSCWWDNVLYRAPRWAPNVPTSWLKTPSYAYVTLTSRVLAFACAFPAMNTWNTKTKGALTTVCTPTLKSVLGLGNIETVYSWSCVCVTAQENPPLRSLLTYYL